MACAHGALTAPNLYFYAPLHGEHERARVKDIGVRTDAVILLGADSGQTATAWAIVAAAVHLGFQLVIHLVVYPGLADQARTVLESAAALHARYTARMALVVAPVYGLLILSTATAVALSPGLRTALAAVLVIALLLVTGVGAVPWHRALSVAEGPADLAAAHRLLHRIDRVRLVLAVAILGCWVSGT